MTKRVLVGVIGVAALMVRVIAAQEALPPALAALADTEREFARTARVKGMRDSFLEFFAPDAIALTPDPTPARQRLLAQEATPFSVDELLWEPRTGDVAASGELGWLTGPSTYINHAGQDLTPHYGNYLSVWRKQPDGRWRVFIDVGTALKAEATFAPGFVRTPFGARYTGREGKAAASASLLEADRRLDAQLNDAGPARAYAPVIIPATRLHRPGGPPAVGPAAIAAWLDANGAGLTAVSTGAESAASGDLGYSYGKYEVAPPKSPAGSSDAKAAVPTARGAYVRIWARDAAGRWIVVADVTQPAPPRQ